MEQGSNAEVAALVEQQEPIREASFLRPTDGESETMSAGEETRRPAREVKEIDRLLASDWGTTTVDRDHSSRHQAETLQAALQTLGYLPAGTAIDGRLGAETINALMAFQVATSGVDTVERRTDGNGRKIYSTDSDSNRLQGIVDGQLGPGTRAKLLEALRAERGRREAGLPEDTSASQRTMGDTPEQRQAIADRLRAAGHDPASVMQVDTSRFRKLGLRPHVLESAIDAWENAYASGQVTNTVVTINDLELPNNMRRSFTFDLANLEEDLKMHELLGHGYGSGRSEWSNRFSGAQRDGSGQSVLGGLVVGQRRYDGGRRYGATADGLEPGINDNADSRLIRMHARRGALSEDMIGRSVRYRSAGCMVLPEQAAKTYRDEAQREGGRFNFNFAPHEQYWGQENAVTSERTGRINPP